MDRVILDTAAIARLAQLKTTVPVCDADGTVIGHFVPKMDPAMYAALDMQISEEELDRREQEPGPRYSTEEVLAMARRRAREGR